MFRKYVILVHARLREDNHPIRFPKYFVQYKIKHFPLFVQTLLEMILITKMINEKFKLNMSTLNLVKIDFSNYFKYVVYGSSDQPQLNLMFIM